MSEIYGSTTLARRPAQPMVAAALAVMVGTGGIATPDVVPYLRATNFLAERSDASAAGADVRAEPEAAVRERLAVVRSNFELSMVDLATVFGVTRQTIYDWNAERQEPQPANLTRLHDLYRLSVAWRSAVGENTETVRRKFADKPQILAVLGACVLDFSSARAALKRLASARATVAPEATSLNRIRQRHGFKPASRLHQEEAIDHAGR